MIPRLSQVDCFVYHSPCTDGFAAAWACWTKFGDKVQYIPAVHNDNKNKYSFWEDKLKDKHVVVGDFSFSREITLQLTAATKSLLILDHHVSASKELAGLPNYYYNNDLSGAGITWRACYGETARVPKIIQYVQDQDLWKWELPQSKEVSSFITSTPLVFEKWDSLARRMEGDLQKIAFQGKAMLKKQSALASTIAKGMETWLIGGYNVPAVNCPAILNSFVCSVLESKGSWPFVATYYLTNGKVVWSLRANKGKVDVSEVAKQFKGGGGHVKSAGFSVPVTEVDFIKCEVH